MQGADWNPTEPAQTVERQSNAQAGSEAERQRSNAQADRQRGREAQHLSELGSETSQLLVRRVKLLLLRVLTPSTCRSCWIN